MSLPPVLHNSFVKAPNKKYQIETFIKWMLVIESFFGVDRLNLIGIGRYAKYTIRIFAFIITVNVIGITVATLKNHITTQIVCYGQVFEHFGCIIFAVTARHGLNSYFDEINIFDSTVCKKCLMKSRHEKIIFISMFILFNALTVASYAVPAQASLFSNTLMQLFPTSIVHNCELFFYTYIVTMIYHRMYSLNTHVESVFSGMQEKDGMSKINEKLENVMKLYRVLSNAMMYLKNGIKWQLALIITCGFIVTPFFSYAVTKLIQGEAVAQQAIISLSIRLVLFAVTQFLPCVACGRMQQQVRRLRTLLATLPCERDLDKRGRVLVREFLTLTEEHDLSLSLFGVLNIDGSIPLQFLSLVLTYHIILLQFEKIIGY